MSSKYDITRAVIAAQTFSTDYPKQIAQIEEQSRLQAAVLEAYEARCRYEEAMDIDALDGQMLGFVALDDALDAAWAALQAHTNGETR